MGVVNRCCICEQPFYVYGNGIEIEDNKFCCATCYRRYVRPAATMRNAEEANKNKTTIEEGDHHDS